MRREIFREYDIRGLAGTDLTPESVELLGLAIGTVMREGGRQRISVGRDCRLSSESYRDALVAGVNASGVSVIDIGVVPTPVLYFSLHHLKSEGGVMITGSHNPAEYNGFKICMGTDSIYGARIQQLYEVMEAGRFARGAGVIENADIMASYQRFILDQIHLPRAVRLAIDCGNGTACLAAPQLLKKLGCEVTELYCEMDGRFPNHHPDPTVEENLRDLQKVVTTQELEVGLAFDGDADRIGTVDNRGRIIWGDMLMILYAREILKAKPAATFISEVKCSMNLFREIEKEGGRAIMWKTGHSLIKAKMKEEGASMAGEMSGHMFFADRYFGYDDAVYAACRLLEIVAHAPEPLSEMLATIPPTVATPEIRIQCDDDKKVSVVERVKTYFQSLREVIDVDGARIVFPDGWGLVRASNTQDILVLRFEAISQASLDKIRSEVEDQVKLAMN
jgi:phosphomannomutase/phosphoglucomutase